MNENKKSQIKWWHLVAAGGGLNLLLGNRNIIIGMLGDILVVIGLGWGILILVKHIYSKVAKKEAKKHD